MLTSPGRENFDLKGKFTLRITPWPEAGNKTKGKPGYRPDRCENML
jgi:hypothetical protein